MKRKFYTLPLVSSYEQLRGWKEAQDAHERLTRNALEVAGLLAIAGGLYALWWLTAEGLI